MQIGESIRTFLVEPLELPLADPSEDGDREPDSIPEQPIEVPAGR